MTSRERVLAAIRHEIPDRVPVDAIAIETVDGIAAHLGIAPDGVLDRLGIDGCIVGAAYVDSSVDGSGRNAWGCADAGDYGTSRDYPLARAETLREIERHPWPDPARFDVDGAARRARLPGDRYAVRGPYWTPVFCQACDLFGMEEALRRMLTDPLLFDAVLDRVSGVVAGTIERLLDACGDAMPILCLGDDFATQRGMMISPERWRRHLKPHYARLFAIGKRKGKIVWFHSCGDVTPVLPDLIDLGVDVWETVQLHALRLSARDLKREYGRHLAFFGGVNTQGLPFASPPEIRDEVRRCIEALGAGGGYICGPDHHIKPDVAPENTVALFDEATAFRAEGYTR